MILSLGYCRFSGWVKWRMLLSRVVRAERSGGIGNLVLREMCDAGCIKVCIWGLRCSESLRCRSQLEKMFVLETSGFIERLPLVRYLVVGFLSWYRI